MTAVAASTAAIDSLADLLEQLGSISPKRVRFRPAPGTATEKDVLAIHDHEGRLYELMDGVLVEKAVGLRASFLATALASILRGFVRPPNLGLVTGEAGMIQCYQAWRCRYTNYLLNSTCKEKSKAWPHKTPGGPSP